MYRNTEWDFGRWHATAKPQCFRQNIQIINYPKEFERKNQKKKSKAIWTTK